MSEYITNYMILSRNSTKELSHTVELSIKHGFQPFGSMTTERIIIPEISRSVQADYTIYYQPMVKIG